MSKPKKPVGPVLGEVAMAMPKLDDRETLRVRKIDNGWLTCREIVKNGKYSETEVYTQARPKFSVPSEVRPTQKPPKAKT